MSAAPNRNIVRFFETQLRERAQADALRVPRLGADRGLSYESVSYAQLGQWVDGAARLLREKGFGQGDRVLVMARPGTELITVVYALFKLGAVPVVIDPGMGLRSFLRCVKRTRPKGLVGIALACVLARIFFRSFKSVRVQLKVERGFCAVCAAAAKETALEAAHCEDTDLAAILFTSGSTGAPKGVCYTHGIFSAQMDCLRGVFGFAPGQVDYPMLPVFSLFNPSLGSTTIVPLINPRQPARADAALMLRQLEYPATMAFGSPVLWAKLCAYCLESKKTLPQLRHILSAGTSVPARVLRQLKQVAPNARVQTPYGATEALPVAVITGEEILEQTAALSEAGRGTCVGQAVGDCRIKIIAIEERPIVSLDEARELPAGQIGEIIVSGSVVTETYDALPQATARAKIRDAQGHIWHRMGDAGYLDTQGRLWFCGRVAERVQTAQGILFTDNCEAIFNTDIDTARTALLGIGAAPNQQLVLAVEPLPGHWPKTPAQRQVHACRLYEAGQAFEHTRRISRFFFVKHFPVDVRHNAKIHRLTLAKKCARKMAETISIVPRHTAQK